MFDFAKGRIRFINGGGYPHCHGVFIDDEVRVFIDPASDENKLEAIDRERAVQVIINSHSHEDHFLFNSRFPNAQLWVHLLDAPPFRDLNTFLEQFFCPEEVNEEELAVWHKFFAEAVKFQPREPDRLLEDDEILVFGETQVRVLHTPGHTPGHLSFHFMEEKVLFLADLDLVKAGPYYGDKASDIDDTFKSLERLATIDVDVYLTSHGKSGVYDGDPAHIQRYLAVINEREEKLIDFLASGAKSLEEVVQRGIIYGGRSLSDGAWDLSMSERSMMRKHLQRLERQGRVREEKDFYHLV